ncbi:MAG: hypothetical protein WC881_12345, partial [Elusimicrobiota bacterium]
SALIAGIVRGLQHFPLPLVLRRPALGTGRAPPLGFVQAVPQTEQNQGRVGQHLPRRVCSVADLVPDSDHPGRSALRRFGRDSGI